MGACGRIWEDMGIYGGEEHVEDMGMIQRRIWTGYGQDMGGIWDG